MLSACSDAGLHTRIAELRALGGECVRLNVDAHKPKQAPQKGVVMKKCLCVMLAALLWASIACAGSKTAGDLWDEFRENQFLFEQTYAGKHTTISGAVSRLSRSVSGAPTVSLKAGGISTVTCYFPESAAPSLARISTDQNITLSGVYRSKMLATIFFEDCRLVR